MSDLQAKIRLNRLSKSTELRLTDQEKMEVKTAIGFRDQVLDALVVDFIYSHERHANNPEQALNDLIAWEQKLTLDPLISSDARALMSLGEQRAADQVNKMREQMHRHMFWDKWVGNDPCGDLDSAVLWIKHIAHRWGRRIDLHKMTKADEPNCYHTHPAHAVRIILANGYVEEVLCDDGTTYEQEWRPGNVGYMPPAFCHRVKSLITGRPSYSLWLRGKIIAPIHLRGLGMDGVYNSTLSSTKED